MIVLVNFPWSVELKNVFVMSMSSRNYCIMIGNFSIKDFHCFEKRILEHKLVFFGHTVAAQMLKLRAKTNQSRVTPEHPIKPLLCIFYKQLNQIFSFNCQKSVKMQITLVYFSWQEWNFTERTDNCLVGWEFKITWLALILYSSFTYKKKHLPTCAGLKYCKIDFCCLWSKSEQF